MYLMLQQPVGDDYVVATGATHRIREFAEKAFARAGLDWRDHVMTDERYMRPTEVDALCGDAGKARRVLGWEPRVTFDELVNEMVDAEMEKLG
jgi:GDPmannose 4,6-dehydratase